MTVPLAPLELLERARRGEHVDPDSVRSFVVSWLQGGATDAQMAAWCMIAALRGIDREATRALTSALIASGDRLDLSSLGPTGDSHSTGGVGDSTTLVAAPLAAALGVRVAKMSGRGLGHTGGTVDKLEAIPGYRTELGLPGFVNQVRHAGCAVISQTSRLTPGDGRLYALRDQTATVESPGLIAASIMSKKLAGGAAAIALDVKCGHGAFFADAEQAREAARLMAWLAEPWERTVRWMVTDMERPLGRMVGNALEVREAAETLQGGGPADIRELAIRAAAELAEASGVVPEGEGVERAGRALASGAALEAAERWVLGQGGTPAVWTQPELVLPGAPLALEVLAPTSGYLAALPARDVGEAIRRLGAGRLHPSQSVDPAVGLELIAQVGDPVTRDEPVAIVHARDRYLGDAGVETIRGLLAIGSAPPEERPLIIHHDREDAEGGVQEAADGA